MNLLPFIAILTPFAFHLQGGYRLRRGRSRVDDFFAVLVGTVLAVVLGAASALYVQAYFASEEAKARGVNEVSQPVWALFLILNVALTYASRQGVREMLERRWRAGVGLKRILIAGSGELGRMVAERILHHRELGISGRRIRGRSGRGRSHRLPWPAAARHARRRSPTSPLRERIDHVYVALPLEEHVKLLDLIELTSRECIDVKIVPDLLQFIALRARLEDLDGLPVINLNDVPLQGVNAWIKRGIDVVLSGAALVALAVPLAIIAAIRPMVVAGAGVLPTGTHGPRRQARSRSTSSARCARTRRRRPGRSGLATTTRVRRAWDNGFAAWIWMNCRSSGTSCAGTCRSSVPGRSGRSSSSSSSIASPVHAASQGEGRHHRVGSGERLARQHLAREDGSSTTCITLKTGR